MSAGRNSASHSSPGFAASWLRSVSHTPTSMFFDRAGTDLNRGSSPDLLRKCPPPPEGGPGRGKWGLDRSRSDRFVRLPSSRRSRVDAPSVLRRPPASQRQLFTPDRGHHRRIRRDAAATSRSMGGSTGSESQIRPSVEGGRAGGPPSGHVDLLCCYVTREFLGFFYDVGRSVICRSIQRVEICAKPLFGVRRAPKITRKEAKAIIDDCIGQTIYRPGTEPAQTEHYAGKKKRTRSRRNTPSLPGAAIARAGSSLWR